MPKDSVLQSAAELLAYIYDDLNRCPLSQERELLLGAGNKSAEDLFHICRLVFGTNMYTAFRRICVDMADYCDSLLDHFDELMQEGHASIIIDAVDARITAVEYLADHAPIDSIEEKAVLDSLAYYSRSCHNHLRKRYRSHIRSHKK